MGVRAYTKVAEAKSKRETTEVPVVLVSRDGSRQESEIEDKTGSALQAVKYLIYEAAQNRVTDIHLEPKGSSVAVRYRIDGILHNTEPLPRDLGSATISAIKVLSSMDISEKRRPQDGSFSAELPGKTVDMRVATAPSVQGERMMLRILDRTQGLMAVENLGMTKKMFDDVTRFAAEPERHDDSHRAHRATARRRRSTPSSTRSTRSSATSSPSRTRSSTSWKTSRRRRSTSRPASRSPGRCGRCCGRTPTSSSWARYATARRPKSPCRRR